MLHAGAAQIVMGNHEFNALCYHTRDEHGGYLRPHNKKNCSQHAETLRYFKKNSGEKERALKWFYSFPLWLDLGFVRVVHAAWSRKPLRSLGTAYLTRESLAPAATKGTPEYSAVETLLKGVEAPLPDKFPYEDKDGNPRREMRVAGGLIRMLKERLPKPCFLRIPECRTRHSRQ